MRVTINIGIACLQVGQPYVPCPRWLSPAWDGWPSIWTLAILPPFHLPLRLIGRLTWGWRHVGGWAFSVNWNRNKYFLSQEGRKHASTV